MRYYRNNTEEYYSNKECSNRRNLVSVGSVTGEKRGVELLMSFLSLRGYTSNESQMYTQ